MAPGYRTVVVITWLRRLFHHRRPGPRRTGAHYYGGGRD